MELFSQKYGHKPVKNIIQVDSMDEDLRNSLWNTIHLLYWRVVRPNFVLQSNENDLMRIFCTYLWRDYFKKPIDIMPGLCSKAIDEIRAHFFSCKWYEVYDFLQFIANRFPQEGINNLFKESCNEMLKREISGYRFIGDVIAPITSEEEIAEIEEALSVKGSLQPVALHLRTAVDLLSDRESPDYRNSIKESISSVEAMSNLVTGKSKATLGDALKVITDKIELHTALQQAFKKLYGYTSDAEGIRHALLEEASLDFEDAKFMLVACSAFVNYLKVKASKVGIQLETD